VRISELSDKTGLKEILFCADHDIIHGYVGDLLSIVMRSAKADSIWFTVQSHVNIVAVAAITGVKAIVLCEGLEFDNETIEKAREEGINLYVSSESSYIAAGKVYELGIR